MDQRSVIDFDIAKYQREIAAIEARLAGDRNATTSIFQRPEDNPRNIVTIGSGEVNYDYVASIEDKERKINDDLKMTDANISTYVNLISLSETRIKEYEETVERLTKENEELGAQLRDVPLGPEGDILVRDIRTKLENNRAEIQNITATIIPDINQQMENYKSNIVKENENKAKIQKRKDFYANQKSKYINAENQRDKERLEDLRALVKDLEESKNQTLQPDQSKSVDSNPIINPNTKTNSESSGHNGPEQNTPEQNTPEQNTPEQNTPEQNTPEQNTPEQNTPEQNTPEQNTPEQNTPEQNTPEQDGPTPIVECKKGHPLLRKAVGILAGVAVGVGLSFVLGPTGTIIALAGNSILKGFIGRQIGLKEAQAMQQPSECKTIEPPQKGIKGFCNKIKNYVTSVEGLKDIQNFLTGTSIGLVVGSMITPTAPATTPTVPEPVPVDSIVESPHVIETLYQTPTLQSGSGPLGYIVNPENGSFISEIKDGIATIVTPGFSGAGSVSGFVPVDALGSGANVGDLVTAAVNVASKAL